MSHALATSAQSPVCRFCGTPLKHTFVDLGTSPLCQRHVTPELFNHAESVYPLHVYVCGECKLVQLPQYVAREEIFDGDYAYFSSFSQTMLDHAKAYVEKVSSRFGLNAGSRVVELASNDGYLLQYFVKRGIKVLGIEPTANTAAEAVKKGVDTLVAFFGVDTARSVRQSKGPADLILGNNVLAHVPDVNDFVGGIKHLLADDGTCTIEFPHLLQLIQHNQFDTIYHEHYSYLSLTAVKTLFERHGLSVFDVEEWPTHGGSLRVFAKHADDARPVNATVSAMLDRERQFGLTSLGRYQQFAEQVRQTKRVLLDFLIAAKREGKTVVGYGAPGKGNTLLNYCGIRTDFIDYTVDRSPHKQGNFLPGSRIPIYAPERIFETKPDYVLILPWNLRDEISEQMKGVRAWGGKFVVPIPSVEVF